jgi:hypothetical protein
MHCTCTAHTMHVQYTAHMCCTAHALRCAPRALHCSSTAHALHCSCTALLIHCAAHALLMRCTAHALHCLCTAQLIHCAAHALLMRCTAHALQCHAMPFVPLMHCTAHALHCELLMHCSCTALLMHHHRLLTVPCIPPPYHTFSNLQHPNKISHSTTLLGISQMSAHSAVTQAWMMMLRFIDVLHCVLTAREC